MNVLKLFNSYIAEKILVVLARFTQIILGLVTLRLLTETLNSDEIGKYYLVLSLISFTSFGFFNPIGLYYNRFSVKWHTRRLTKTAIFAFVMLRTSMLAPSMLFLSMVFVIFNYHQYFDFSYYFALLLLGLFASINATFLGIINIIHSLRTFATWTIIVVGANFASGYVFLLYLDTGTGWLLGTFISQLLLAFPIYKVLVEKTRWDIKAFYSAFNYEKIYEIIRYTLPLSCILMLQWGQQYSNTIIIEHVYGIEFLADIAIGLAISAAILHAAESVINQICIPIYLKKINDATMLERQEAYNDLTNLLFPIYLGLAVSVFFSADALAALLVADKFSDVGLVVKFGVCIETIRILANLLSHAAHSELKTSYLMVPNFIACLVLLLGVYIFSKSQPTIYILCSNVVALSAYIISNYYYMKKLLPIKIAIIPSLTMLIFMALISTTVTYILSNYGFVINMTSNIMPMFIYLLIYILMIISICGKNIITYFK